MRNSVTTEFFNQQVENFAARYSKKACFQDRLNLFVEAIRRTTPPGGSVLDFGCGPGIMALALAGNGFRVLGLDGSSAMVARARADGRKQQIKGAEFYQADAATLKLEALSFDAVVCSSVLEYVSDDWGLLRRLIASLKVGGHLCVSVPQSGSLLVWAEDLLRITKFHLKRAGSRHLAHSLHRYQPRTFLAQLREMDIDSLTCTTFEFPFLGAMGVALSHWRLFGAMLFVVGQKRRGPNSSVLIPDGSCQHTGGGGPLL